jgi:ElaB/YqjD/DUF883 family membrane-anchored ribosome-binding protein
MLMFRRKPKTRMERARAEYDKFRKHADDARKDVIRQLNRSARHLRSDVEHLLEGEQRNRAQKLAQELEHLVDDIEHRAEKRIGEVSQQVSQNIWTSVLIAFGIGLLVGLLLKILKD